MHQYSDDPSIMPTYHNTVRSTSKVSMLSDLECSSSEHVPHAYLQNTVCTDLLSSGHLLFIVVVDAASVLSAHVIALPIHSRGIHVLEETV